MDRLDNFRIISHVQSWTLWCGIERCQPNHKSRLSGLFSKPPRVQRELSKIPEGSPEYSSHATLDEGSREYSSRASLAEGSREYFVRFAQGRNRGLFTQGPPGSGSWQQRSGSLKV